MLGSCVNTQTCKQKKTHQDTNTWKSDILICSPNKTTDATIERTIAAAAEKPFIMLSVYFTTTDVYRPPTLANTGGAKRNVCSVMELKRDINQRFSDLVVLTYYKAHPGGIAEEETFLQDLITIIHIHSNQSDHDARQVHLDVSHPKRCVWALQHLFKVHTFIRKTRNC